MNSVRFHHSLASDWSHGHARCLRGIVADHLARGHTVRALEPRDAWRVEDLLRERGDNRAELARRHAP